VRRAAIAREDDAAYDLDCAANRRMALEQEHEGLESWAYDAATPDVPRR